MYKVKAYNKVKHIGTCTCTLKRTRHLHIHSKKYINTQTINSMSRCLDIGRLWKQFVQRGSNLFGLHYCVIFCVVETKWIHWQVLIIALQVARILFRFDLLRKWMRSCSPPPLLKLNKCRFNFYIWMYTCIYLLY